MRKSTTNNNVETKITPTNRTFNEMLTESIGAPNGTNAKQFNNQSIKKINLDEYNFDTNDNRNPNDWLANAMFCLTLEDRANKMTDGEKISSLMRALKGNLKETMFAKLRNTPEKDLTLQKFQELFRKLTTKSIREIENRLAKVSKNEAGSYQNLYMQVENLLIEQMMLSGLTKNQLNKEVIQTMTERLFKKKCHQESETFQTSTKSGQELIDLANQLDEFKESVKSINNLIKIEPRKKNTGLINEKSMDQGQRYNSYHNRDNQEDYNLGNRQTSVRWADFPQRQYLDESHYNNYEGYWATKDNTDDYNDCNNADYNNRPFHSRNRY